MFYTISFADMGPGQDQGQAGSELQVEVNLVKVETQVTCPVSVAQVLVLPTLELHQRTRGRRIIRDNIAMAN